MMQGIFCWKIVILFMDIGLCELAWFLLKNNFHKCDLIVIAPLFFMKGDEYEQVCAARAGKSSAD